MRELLVEEGHGLGSDDGKVENIKALMAYLNCKLTTRPLQQFDMQYDPYGDSDDHCQRQWSIGSIKQTNQNSLA